MIDIFLIHSLIYYILRVLFDSEYVMWEADGNGWNVLTCVMDHPVWSRGSSEIVCFLLLSSLLLILIIFFINTYNYLAVYNETYNKYMLQKKYTIIQEIRIFTNYI